MKILMVNKFLYPRGGSESYMLKIAAELKARGNEVEYFGMYDEKNTVGNSAGEYTQNMDFHSKSLSRFLYPFKIIYSKEARKKIGRVLDDFKPDIVHMNNINFQLTPSVIYAVKERNIPLVQTVHDYQMLCPNHLMYNFRKNEICTKCVGKSKISCIKNRCIHGSIVKSIIGAAEYYTYSLLKTYKMVDLYICPSKFLENKLNSTNKIYNGKTFMIHNFVEEPPKKLNKSGKPYIVFIGRFSAEKGVELLGKAARLLPDIHFKAVGSGPDADALSGIENVELTGFLTGAALTEVLSGASALIAPSVCFENCPLSILEAQSMGIPVITMNYGGMAELAEEGVTGTLAERAEPECLANAVRRLFDGSEYEKIKKSCEERKNKILSVREYADILTDKYKELSGGGEYAKGKHYSAGV